MWLWNLEIKWTLQCIIWFQSPSLFEMNYPLFYNCEVCLLAKAMPFSLVCKSGMIASKIFFFGYNWTLGLPVAFKYTHHVIHLHISLHILLTLFLPFPSPHCVSFTCILLKSRTRKREKRSGLHCMGGIMLQGVRLIAGGGCVGEGEFCCRGEVVLQEEVYVAKGGLCCKGWVVLLSWVASVSYNAWGVLWAVGRLYCRGWVKLQGCAAGDLFYSRGVL